MATMTALPPDAEAFLTGFHDRRPGLTSKVYAALPVVFRGGMRASTYELLAAVVPRNGGRMEVLDLACGDGFLLSLLASRSQQGLALSGVDMSAGELEAARARLGGAASLVQARAQELPYATGRFDCVLCHLALMLVGEAERAVGEIRRTLKEGGKLAAIVGAPAPESPVMDHYRRALSRHERQEEWSTLRLGDKRLRSVEGIAELMRPGFGDLAVEDIVVPMRLSPRELWRFLLDMYDLYLFGEAERKAIGEELVQALGPECAADGRFEYRQAMRYFTATAS